MNTLPRFFLIQVVILKFDLFLLQGADGSFSSSIACWPTNATQPKIEALHFNILSCEFRRIGTAMIRHNAGLHLFAWQLIYFFLSDRIGDRCHDFKLGDLFVESPGDDLSRIPIHDND